jgi:hypothetical protein
MLLATTLVAFVLAFVFLANAVYFYRQEARERSTWATAGGVVVELNERRPSPLETAAFDAVVRFTSSDGATVQFEDREGSLPPRYAVGEAVRVLYAPGAPQLARIDTGADWRLVTPFLAFGVLFLLLGAALVWFSRSA